MYNSEFRFHSCKKILYKLKLRVSWKNDFGKKDYGFLKNFDILFLNCYCYNQTEKDGITNIFIDWNRIGYK